MSGENGERGGGKAGIEQYGRNLTYSCCLWLRSRAPGRCGGKRGWGYYGSEEAGSLYLYCLTSACTANAMVYHLMRPPTIILTGLPHDNAPLLPCNLPPHRISPRTCTPSPPLPPHSCRLLGLRSPLVQPPPHSGAPPGQPLTSAKQQFPWPDCSMA